ncbi:antibiotic biosynthesis monooxygenase [Saccharomonospora piscinae]|uniref:antibiotic biosynthesis monooxygenase family protein n=1 Tax=Saccharomonospora piscinae TaxID=687388 RepID=UPI001106FA6A|nr:antibiotic biosynthesis monooxygenase [Saccharomonospora piscinae]TLW91787.1 antibiotic biosynthesis monooxygenase [Saccharomonospora piscinae]
MALADREFPDPPYYAVIFVSHRTDDDHGYAATAERMVQLAAEQPGFLGVDSARDPAESGGLGITVSYWRDERAIEAWRRHAEHTLARETGRERWYEEFDVHVTRVTRRYGFRRPSGQSGQ